DVAFTVLFPDLVPPPDNEDLQALRSSTAEYGIDVAVVLDEHDGVIDGACRLRSAAELGLPLSAIHLDVRGCLTLDAKRALAVRLNSVRRHLSPKPNSTCATRRVTTTAPGPKTASTSRPLQHPRPPRTDSPKP